MGTERKIKHTQQNILAVLKQIGMTPPQFAGRYFDKISPNSDDEDERMRFLGKFKKQLNRPGKTDKILNQLEAYLSSIYDLKEFKNAGLIAPRNIAYPELDDTFRRGMARISKKIDDALEEKTLIAEESDWDD